MNSKTDSYSDIKYNIYIVKYKSYITKERERKKKKKMRWEKIIGLTTFSWFLRIDF